MTKADFVGISCWSDASSEKKVRNPSCPLAQLAEQKTKLSAKFGHSEIANHARLSTFSRLTAHGPWDVCYKTNNMKTYQCTGNYGADYEVPFFHRDYFILFVKNRAGTDLKWNREFRCNAVTHLAGSRVRSTHDTIYAVHKKNPEETIPILH